VFLGLTVLAWWHLRASQQWSVSQVIEVVLPFLVALVFFALSLTSATMRVGAAVITIILATGFLALDTYLSRADVLMPYIAHARRLGVEFDPRLPKEVVFDARDKGQPLTLPVLPADYLFGFSGATLFSHPPLSTVVLCNELGSYEFIETDEYGFNNPRGLWGAGKIDVMLIGDSFVEGYCVPRDARLAEVVRQAYPAMLNLGRGGLGSLGELALVREYAPAIRPKVIVWCFFENDLADLRIEAQVPTLSRYLRDREFSQNLYPRRDEVNRLVTATIENRISILQKRQDLPFRGTRNLLNYWVPRLLSREAHPQEVKSGDDFNQLRSTFTETLREAHRAARSLDAELIFFYLRDFTAHGQSSEAAREHSAALMVKNVLEELGIPMVDVGDAVRARYADPRNMHRLTDRHPTDTPGNLVGHYNAAGHRFVGEVITETLRTRFPALENRPPIANGGVGH
jgi:hypothetical protein